MKENEKCRCPYCDTQIETKPPFCIQCKVELRFCNSCGKAIPKNANICPWCGEKQ